MVATVLIIVIVALLGGAFWLLYVAPRREARRKVDELVANRRRPTVKVQPRPMAPADEGPVAPVPSHLADVPTAPAGGEPDLGWLIGLSPAVKGRSYKITRRPITIGRATTNYIQVSGKRVSRVHCQLLPTAQGLRVTDLKSSNHTVVNGHAVRSAILKGGDVLEVGGYQFVYEPEGQYTRNDGLAQKEVGDDINEETSIIAAG